jgi:hypothetical protein
MNPSTSHSIKHRTTAKDVFYTPKQVAITHIQSIEVFPDEHMYDPFAGKKVYYDNFPTENKSWTELSDGKDFFAYDKKGGVIISNPPYSIIDDVLKHTLMLEPRVFSYLLLEGKMTPRRLEIINKAGYGMTGMYICKVFKWYGMAVAYTFTKGCENKAVVIYDRIVHRE